MHTTSIMLHSAGALQVIKDLVDVPSTASNTVFACYFIRETPCLVGD